ncbi:MAG TPA: monovalent cation/H(+) antiporter subunit G [Sphingopyxis sp.]|nr:monovalent cation/H(+) antiporter subunit G [Sphingopyxis sp.]
MIQAPNLPIWAALLVGILLLSGAAVTLIGTIGLVTLKSYYERVHAPTLGATVGAMLILSASIICFSVMQSRPVVHEVLIFIFITITTPVTLMLITRATIYRDRIAGSVHVPPEILDDKPEDKIH